MQAFELLADSTPDARSVEEYRSIVDALDALRIAVAIFDHHDRLTYCNAHLSYVFPSFRSLGPLKGLKYEQLLRCKLNHNEIAGSWALEDPEGWIAHKLELRRNPLQTSFEERLSDGRWIRINERGLKEGGTIRAYTDVTDAKADHFRVLGAVQDGRDAVAFWDQCDRLIMRNETFDEIFNTLNVSIHIGLEFSQLLEIAADYHFFLGDDLPEAWIAERTRLHHLPEHQDIWRHRDGRWFLINEHRSRDGGIVMRLSDVTEIKENERAMIERGTSLASTVHELEMSKIVFEKQSAEHVNALEELAYAKAELEAANTSRSRFLSIMSHELRTPMNAIIGFSEILTKELLGPLGNKKYQEYASDIFTSGQHLLSLINDLLDMSKVDAGKWELRRGPVNIEALIRSCCRLMSEQAVDAGALIEVSITNAPKVVNIDERAIRQVLLNLLSNALKFTGQNGLVRISAWQKDQNLVVAITDNGVGIREDDLARVFQPFEQGENNLDRAHEGTGLGLSLCKSLVELHTGTIRLDSSLGRGTTVTFQLPIVAERD